jgi:hypothetical protein
VSRFPWLLNFAVNALHVDGCLGRCIGQTDRSW